MRPASDLFGTALAADDLNAVLEALHIASIDLYGDSYGSWFSQAFAVRHPDKLRSLVLDGTYPVSGLNPWYPELTGAAYHAFNATCERNANCASLPGTSMDRLTALLGELRAHPFRGTGHDANGNPHDVIANPASLAYLFYGNGPVEVLYHDMDAAARALLEEGDRAPLLRLLAENGVSSSGYGSYKELSNAIFVAVSCLDYPQIYDVASPPALRFGQEAAAITGQNPAIYSPFTIGEFRAMPLFVSLLDMCLTWPSPSPAHPPVSAIPPGAVFPAVPTLALSGELDTLTPAKQGAEAAALFPNARHIVFANSFHVDALGDEFDCASAIVRRFVETLQPGDTSCAAAIPEVRTVPRFATGFRQIPPAAPAAGNSGTEADLRASAAAVLTAGDAVARWWVNTSGFGVGLRGGQAQYALDGDTVRIQLTDSAWVNDLPVSGAITWTPFENGGLVTADLSFPSPSGTASLHAAWRDKVSHPAAALTGTIGGRAIAAAMPAP